MEVQHNIQTDSYPPTANSSGQLPATVKIMNALVLKSSNRHNEIRY